MTSAALKKQKPARRPPFTTRALAEGMRFNEQTKVWVDRSGNSFDEEGMPLPTGPEKDAAEDRAATEKTHGKPLNLAVDWEKLDWTDCEDDGQRDRILTTIVIGGVWFHVEGVAVFEDDLGCQTAESALGTEQLDLLFDIGGAGRFQTAKIDGIDYVIFLTPHSG